MTSIHFRPATAGELDLILSLPGKPASDVAADWADGHRRPEWCWLAFAEGRHRPLARALWRGVPGAAYPLLLDTLTVDVNDPAERRAAGAALLSAALSALTPPEGPRPRAQLILPPGWRDHPDVRSAAEDWIAMAAGAGLEPAGERTGFQRAFWPAGPVIPSTDQEFRQAGEEELLPLLSRALPGTARERLAEARDLGSRPEWWRVLGDRGFVLPGRTKEGMGFIGPLGVVPEHRGHGHAGQLLGEGLRVLAAAGVQRVRADADDADAPMIEALRGAGFALAYARLDFR